MSPRTERNKHLASAYIRAMGRASEQGPFQYVSRGFRMSGGLLTGELDLPGAIAWRDEVLRAFPDVRFDVDRRGMVAEEGRVVARVRWRATHRGAYLGVPATGRPVDVPMFVQFQIRNGLIERESHLTDSLLLLRQLQGKATGSSAGPGVPPSESPPEPGLPSHPAERFFVPPENLTGLAL